MLSYGYMLVQLLVTLIRIPWTSADLCSLANNNLQASSSASSLVFPNYVSNYPPSATCTWTIYAQWGKIIELEFVSFDTEGNINWRSSGCSSTFTDHLEIYDGSQELESRLLGRYCGTSLPPNVYSSGTSLLLKFKSDAYVERAGFHLKYTAVVPKPEPSICSPFNTFSQNNAIEYSGTSGYIESPLYGSKYPSNMQCTWVITVPKGKKVKLSFSDFDVGKLYYICSERHDYLEIRDGKFSSSLHIKSLCDKSIPSPVYSTGRHMWIRFQSNSDNFLYVGHKRNGFKARYEAELAGDITGVIVGIIIAVVVVVVFIVCCIYIRKRRSPGLSHMPQTTMAQTTLTYNNQDPTSATSGYRQQTGSGIASYPHVLYPPATQGNYPPPSSGYPPPQQGDHQQPPPVRYPSASGDNTATAFPAQPSTPMKTHPSQTLMSDPPPDYPDVVPDIPPPPYPGVSQNLSNQV